MCGSHEEFSVKVFSVSGGCGPKVELSLRRLWYLYKSIDISCRVILEAVFVGTKESPLFRRDSCCWFGWNCVERLTTSLFVDSSVSVQFSFILKKSSNIATYC